MASRAEQTRIDLARLRKSQKARREQTVGARVGTRMEQTLQAMLPHLLDSAQEQEAMFCDAVNAMGPVLRARIALRVLLGRLRAPIVGGRPNWEEMDAAQAAVHEQGRSKAVEVPKTDTSKVVRR